MGDRRGMVVLCATVRNRDLKEACVEERRRWRERRVHLRWGYLKAVAAQFVMGDGEGPQHVWPR